MVPYYEYALDMILDVEMPVGQTLTEEQQVRSKLLRPPKCIFCYQPVCPDAHLPLSAARHPLASSDVPS